MRSVNQNVKDIAEHYSRITHRSFPVPDKYEKTEIKNRSQIRVVRYRPNIKQVDINKDGRVDHTITRLVSFRAPVKEELIYAQVEHYAKMPWRFRVSLNFRMDTHLTTLDVFSGRWAIDTFMRRMTTAGGSRRKRIPIYGCMEFGEEEKQFHVHLLLTEVPSQYTLTECWKDFGSVGEVLDLQTATDRDRAIGYVVVRELQYSQTDDHEGTSYSNDLIIKRHKYKPRRVSNHDNKTTSHN